MNLFRNICIGLIFAGTLTSCYDLLEENPKDFLTPDNSFVDKAGFESSLAGIYSSIRTNFYCANGMQDNAMITFDDDQIFPRNGTTIMSYYKWEAMTADNQLVRTLWGKFYSIIYSANVIIDRAENPKVKWNDEVQKNAIVGEARFLRAFCYRFLANIWGDVPLVIHETTSPQFNYVNSPQQDVYKQCKEDLLFAIKWMPDIDNQQGGRASKVAAQHLLSEILIQMKDYEGAIKAASDVINNPAMSLMTERFGVLKDFQFEGHDYQGEKEPWGDVYWDLFRENNFNRIDGNKECIWNIQSDYSIEGGGFNNPWGGNFCLDRWFGASLWWRAKDIDGVSNYLKAICGGRPIDALGVSDYAATTIWKYKGDWDKDIRNNKFNCRRDFFWTNPESRFYGQRMTPENLGDKKFLYDISRPIFQKIVTAVPHGGFQDPSSKEFHDQGATYKDWYIMRLAETYLLRAEAYMLSGNLESAADDINVIRNRSQATPVVASDVDMELILDERSRELLFEEHRINTLFRTGKMAEHLSKYNMFLSEQGIVLDDHYNRFPIPNSEIEANKEGGLVQNPGW